MPNHWGRTLAAAEKGLFEFSGVVARPVKRVLPVAASRNFIDLLSNLLIRSLFMFASGGAFTLDRDLKIERIGGL